ncbi:MAG: CNP1-like family protein [Rhodocyclaceae bacterium]|nr:CNP1-like family protein [Rhodocyclaceae bacterium]
MSARALAGFLLCAFVASQAQGQVRFKNWEDPDEEPWKESAYTLPTFPREENLIEFYVGPAVTGKYFIDQSTIGAGGNDNVVRYAMVVKTTGGATNISYEGLRCDTGELRIYATGRADGTWVESRQSEWRPLKAQSLNRHQGALFVNYFCPNRIAVWTAKEGREALKRGSHPDLAR